MDQLLNTENITKYAEIIKSVINRVVKKDTITFFDIVTIAMGVVEQLSPEFKAKGENKKSIAKSMIPLVVDILVTLDKVKANDADELKKDLLDKAEMIDQFIDTAALLTNDPDLINTGKWIVKTGKKVAKSCCFGSKKKK